MPISKRVQSGAETPDFVAANTPDRQILTVSRNIGGINQNAQISVVGAYKFTACDVQMVDMAAPDPASWDAAWKGALGSAGGLSIVGGPITDFLSPPNANIDVDGRRYVYQVSGLFNDPSVIATLHLEAFSAFIEFFHVERLQR